MDNNKGLSIEDIIFSLEEIAHFHAVSYAYGIENKINWTDSFAGIFPKFMKDEGLLKDVENNFKLFIGDLKEHGAPLDHIEKAERLEKEYSRIFTKYMNIDDPRFLIHGDFWGNNVMFGESKSKFKKILIHFG